MIRFACPKCQKIFQVDDNLAGRQAKCSQCKETISIPSHSSTDSFDGTSPNPKRRTETVGVQRATTQQSTQQPLHSKSRGQAPVVVPESDDSTTLGISTVAVIGLGGILLITLAVIFGWFILSFQSGDQWESRNTARITKMLDEAKIEQSSNPLKAYRLFGDVMTETKQHTIKDENLIKAIAEAEKFRTTLGPRIDELVRAEEAEKKRLAEEEAKRAEEERLRIADREQRMKEEQEAKRIAEQEMKEREKRKKEAAARYLNPPQSARTALNAIKKLQARTEIGINLRDYSTIVGETYAEVKVFCDSPDGESIQEFSSMLLSAIDKYKMGMDLWKGKIEITSDVRYHESGSELVLQECWSAAGKRISVAEQLLKKDGLELGLPNYEKLTKSDEIYTEKMKSIKVDLISLYLQQKLVSLSKGDEGRQAEYDQKLKEFQETFNAMTASETLVESK
jgi:hypothetical protein